ncbi:MAG TPA: hypothetical protein VI685_12930 [Candidatus Angelobacter sp.]
MKSVRRYAALCTFMLTLGVLAAYPCSAPAQGQEQTSAGAGPGSMPSVEDQLKDLTAKLNLSDDQQSKIKSVLEDQQQQMQAEKTDNSLSREDRLSNVRRIRHTANSKIRDLLNDEQKVKFDQMQKRSN